jgi:uncharacterized membrane protein YeaQ/YmgE (transglycosylase-associated protein family)
VQYLVAAGHASPDPSTALLTDIPINLMLTGHARSCAWGPGILPGKDQGCVMSIIVWLIVGAIAGWLAGMVVKGGGFGLIGDIIVGIVGAVIAGYLLPAIGLYLGGGIIGAIIDAFIGAVILLLIIRLIKRA